MKCCCCSKDFDENDKSNRYRIMGLGPQCGKKIVTDQFLETKENKRCILCHVRPAETTEHPIKSSLIKKSKRKEDPGILIMKGKIKEFYNPSSAKQKDKDLCKLCNNQISQDADFGFDSFVEEFESAQLEVKPEHLVPLNDYTEEILKEIAQNCKSNKDLSKLSKEDRELIIGFQFDSLALLKADKWWFSLDHIPQEKMLQIKRFYAKSLACKLNRYQNPVPDELGEIFNQNYTSINELKIRFSKTTIMECQNGYEINANLQSGFLKNGDCFFVQAMGPFIVEVHFNHSGIHPEGFY